MPSAPSLSPDQTKIAYKKHLDNKARACGDWPYWIFGLGRESLLAETRSVDDQVEWLYNNRLLHTLSRPGSEATTSDVWLVSGDGTAHRRSSSQKHPHQR
jgi:hypothetical protein